MGGQYPLDICERLVNNFLAQAMQRALNVAIAIDIFVERRLIVEEIAFSAFQPSMSILHLVMNGVARPRTKHIPSHPSMVDSVDMKDGWDRSASILIVMPENLIRVTDHIKT